MGIETFEETQILAYLAGLCKTGRNRKLREDAGLSQRDLAHTVKVRQSTLCGWEFGKKPRLTAAARYAAALLALDPDAPADLVAALARP